MSGEGATPAPTDSRSVDQSAPTRTAPVKSKVACGIFVIWGILAVFAGFIMLAFTEMAGDLPVDGLVGFGLVITAIFFATAIMNFSLAYGVWHRRRWGWVGSILVSALFSIVWLYELLTTGEILDFVFLFVAAFCLVAFWVDRSAFEVTP